MKKNNSKAINNLVIVAALGYFVDVYDLTLFGIVRKTAMRKLDARDASKIFTN